MAYKDKEKAREYQKGWYQQHKGEVIERRKKRQLEIRHWFMRYKSSLSCINCGISHPAVLQFHHRNKEEKSFTISKIITRTHISLRKLEEEISRCDILCGNCHAKHHWKETHEFDDWREVLPPVD